MATEKAIQRATGRAPALENRPALQQYIKQMSGEIKKALPSVMTPERFTRIVLSALSTNPKLAETTPQSFLGAMMTAAQLAWSPTRLWDRPICSLTGTPRPTPINANFSSVIRACWIWPTAAGRSVSSRPMWSIRRISSPTHSD